MVNKTGIYIIKNNVDGKVYIGQTMRSFKFRWSMHKRELRNNNHSNYHLQSAWNKYGEQNFSFEILEICKTLEECNESEERLIKEYGAFSTNQGYNMTSGGRNYEVSQETKDYMELRWLVIKQTEEMAEELFSMPYDSLMEGYRELPIKYQELESNGFTICEEDGRLLGDTGDVKDGLFGRV